MSSQTIIVTGASGQLGRLIVQDLLKTSPQSRIVGLVRTEAAAAVLRDQGAEARIANYDDAASLRTAMSGVDRVLLVSSSEVGRRVPQHVNVIEAARSAGISSLAYTSILNADTNPMALAVEHRETERLIRASGLPFAFLRNGWYTENYTQSIGLALQHGALIGSAGHGKLSTAARADYAAGAAAVIGASTFPEQAIYELAGDEAYTLADLASEISRQSHKAVVFQNLAEADYAAALASFGLPGEFARILADSDARAAEGVLFEPGKALSRLIGRPTTPMASTVAAALAALK